VGRGARGREQPLDRAFRVAPTKRAGGQKLQRFGIIGLDFQQAKECLLGHRHVAALPCGKRLLAAARGSGRGRLVHREDSLLNVPAEYRDASGGCRPSP